MVTYIFAKVLHFIFVIVGIATLLFAILSFSTDPIKLFVAIDATAAEIERVREQKGFNDPFPVRYARFMKQTLTGDLGNSFRFNYPVTELIAQRLPATLQLAFASLLIAMVGGVPLGILAALKRGSAVDSLITSGAVLAQGMPVFWLGILLILLFAVELKVLPASGSGSLKHLLMPAVTLAAIHLAQFARLTRSSMLEVLHQDYVRTARAKGLLEKQVILVHTLKNAGTPILTLLAVSLSTLFGGAIVTETIFAWPGLGRLLASAVLDGDYPVVQGVVLVIGSLVASISFLADIIHAYIDPRIRPSQ